MHLIRFQDQQIRTQRLILRPVEPKDAEMIFQLRSDSEVNRYIKRALMPNRFEAIAFIDQLQEDMRLNKLIYWMLEDLSNQQTLGSICLWNFSEDHNTAEIGYTLHTIFQGQGFMQEALSAVLRFGFETLALQYLEAFTHYENSRSIHLLNKFNFTKKPERKDPGFEHNAVFVLPAANWKPTAH